MLILGVTIGFVASHFFSGETGQIKTLIQYEQPVEFEDWHGNVKRSSAL
jgi:hypothetical protein